MAYLDKVNVSGQEYGLGKPIYYHPIYLIGKIGGVLCARIQFTILDNQATAYTDDSIITKIKSLLSQGAFINANGWYLSSSTYYCVYMIYRSVSTDLVSFNSGSESNNVDFDLIDWTCVDGVNQIN